jgi:hypothetical protein
MHMHMHRHILYEIRVHLCDIHTTSNMCSFALQALAVGLDTHICTHTHNTQNMSTLFQALAVGLETQHTHTHTHSPVHQRGKIRNWCFWIQSVCVCVLCIVYCV